MSWVTIASSMIASVCGTLAAMHLLVWFRQKDEWAKLLFALGAVAVAVLAGIELAMMRAETAAQYGVLLRWGHLPSAVLVICIVWFVRLFLQAGRTWLGWVATGTRMLALILNFLFTPNLNFLEITDLGHVHWWGGETVSVPVGLTNPWSIIGLLSHLSVVIFCVDAAISVWRRGDRRQSLMVGGSAVLFFSVAMLQTVLIVWGGIHIPFFFSFSFLGMILAMGYELTSDVVLTAQLSRRLKTSEAELRESEERLLLAAEAASAGLWGLDPKTGRFWTTPKLMEMLGYAPESSLDLESFLNAVHPEDRDRLRKTIEQGFRSQVETRAEFRSVLPSGQIRWFSARGRSRPTSNGVSGSLMGVTVDVTDRKLAEEALWGERALTDAIFDSAPGMLYVYTAQGRLLRWNRQHETMTGYSAEELAHTELKDLFEGEALATVTAAWQKAFAGQRVTIEVNVKAKGGAMIPCLLTGVGLEFDDEPHLVGIGFDLTEYRQTEREVLRQRQELAHLSRVTMLGELSGSIAHELNQPLTAILSNAQAAQRFLARDNVDLEELAAILADIVEEDKRAGEIIRGLRQMLKKSDTQRQALDLNDMVQGVLTLVRSDLLNQGVSAHTELMPALPAVRGNRVQLQQVLLNLVLNACDAMSGNAASDRHFFIQTEAKGGGAVTLSVRDRGEGIPSDKLEQIFEPFFTTKREGLGMGLAVCQSIISAHGGKLWAANSPDKGAIFSFTLPITS
jgi:PAS domain S-box-containing protein